jgi:glycosyl hydrolase family 8
MCPIQRTRHRLVPGRPRVGPARWPAAVAGRAGPWPDSAPPGARLALHRVMAALDARKSRRSPSSGLLLLLALAAAAGGGAACNGAISTGGGIGDDDDDGGGGGGGDDDDDDGGGGLGCAGDGSAAQPFGNHARPYAAGAILPDHLSQQQLDDAVAGFYDTWKARYLVEGCGEGRVYIGYQGPDKTVSEAHGYGMLATVLMAGHDPAAHDLFDGMVRYYEDHRSELTPDLMAWKQSGCGDVEGANSATDGDLDIAYALLLADRQWGSGGAIDYATLAGRVIDGIRAGEVDAAGRYLLIGDWTGGGGEFYAATRSSDFMPGHLASFGALAGGDWAGLLDSEYDFLARVQRDHSPEVGLLPDFLLDPAGAVRPPDGQFLEADTDGSYGYNACRDPWRIASHFVTSGDPRAQEMMQPLNAWIQQATGGDPAAIRAGYRLDGTPQPDSDYTELAFIAPFGVAAMVGAENQAWLNDMWDEILAETDGGYYGDSIKLLSLIVMSGNWWTPEAAPCQ